MPERDPRTDPQPGDVLRGTTSERMVMRREEDSVGFTYWRVRNGLCLYGAGNDCYARLETWRKWAADAEIVRQA